MGGWMVMDRREAHALQTSSAAIRAGISDWGTQPTDRSVGKPSVERAIGDLDLGQVAESLSKLQKTGGLSEMEELMRFEQRLSRMSRSELLAALDALAGLNLSPEARLELEKMILAQLVSLDPAAALRRYAGKIQGAPSEIGLQLADAMRDWAKSDLAGATAWLDQQLASGNLESKSLDGRSEIRTQFEAALVEVLVGSDSVAAGRRLESLPEDQRREILQQIPFADLSSEEQKAYAELVRKWVPAAEQPGSFADMGGKMVEGNAFPQVAEFLDSVQATPTERYAAAKQGAESQMDALSRAGTVTKESVDSLRDWVAQQAPGQADLITGKSLAEASQNGGKLSADDAANLVIQYQQRSGNDDLLVAFIQGYAARSNLQAVQALVLKIKDPQVRATYTR